MTRTLFACSPQQLKLLTLMGLIALLTLGAEGPDGCCANPEDGQQNPALIQMQVNVDLIRNEFYSGTSGTAEVTTRCSGRCPSVVGWSVSASPEIYPISTEPDPLFRFEVMINPQGSLAGAEYDPRLNRIIREASLSFEPRLDPVSASLTTITGGRASLKVWAFADDPEIVSLQEEDGRVSLYFSGAPDNVTVGSSGEFLISASNQGLGVVEITRVFLEPHPWGSPEDLTHYSLQQLPGLPLELSQGRTTSIRVTFSPLTAGKKSIVLVVTGRAPGAPNSSDSRISLSVNALSP